MDFGPVPKSRLPETHGILEKGNLSLHPAVCGVVLHGSRGPQRGFRPDSDIDISLIVEVASLDREARVRLLQDVIDTALQGWAGPVELDLAAVFDSRDCGLACFDVERWSDGEACELGGTDCFGLYKSQKGFRGFVEGQGIQVRLMQPCLKIWVRD